MDTLVFSPREKQNRGGVAFVDTALRVISALLLSGSTIALVIKMLGLRYGAGDAFSGSIIGGLISVWNRIADTLGSTSFQLVTKYESVGGEHGLFITAFLVLLAIASYMLIRSEFTLGLLVFVIPIAIFSIVFKLYAPSAYYLVFGLSVLLAIIVMKNRSAAVSGLITLASCGAILGMIVLGLDSNEMDVRPRRVEEIGNGVVAAMQDGYYGKDPLGHGDLRLAERSDKDGIAIRVSMSDPQSIYLKGFIGSTFNGRKWSELSNSVYYDAEPRMEALRANGFTPIMQMGDVAEYTYDDTKDVEMSIEVVGADSRYAFLPYEISDMKSLDTYSVKGGDLPNPGRYGKFRKYEIASRSSLTNRWTDEAARLFTMALGSIKENKGETSGSENSIGDYLALESHFNEFVYDNYTYVSVGDMEVLANYIGEPYDISEGHLDYKTAISSIRRYLEENFIYTEKVGGDSSESGNQLKRFFETGKGFDVHFATAATIMFRYYGIPARYVEGYLITPDDIEGIKGGDAIEVGFNKAHAWTEIYVDGLGFVPLEVTPEFYGVMNEADMTVGISNDSLMSEFQESFGGKPLGSPDEDMDAAKEEKSGGNNALQLLLKIIVLAIALGLVIVLLRKLIPLLILWIEEEKLMKRFKEEPAKEASAAIYGYMEKRELPISARVMEIGNLAAYSQENFDEGLRNTMLVELKKAKEEVKNRRREKMSLNNKKLAGSLGCLIVFVLVLGLTLTGCTKNSSETGYEDVALDAMRTETAARVKSNAENPIISSVGGEWAIYGVMKSQEGTDEDYANLYWDNVRAEIKRGKGKIETDYYSDYARIALGLSAIGKDLRDVEGYDLSPYLEEYDRLTEQGVTAVSFALIASGVQGIKLENEERYLEFILKELEGGEFYSKSEMSDYVSMSLQSLAGYKDRDDVKQTIDACLESLSNSQLDDGSLGNCESTVECIIALVELGIDPLKDERFIKDGKTLLDGLSVYYLGDGNFMHANPQAYPDINEPDKMSTEKALLALDAITLGEKGEHLYS